jgi:hypothetical protein
LVDKLSFRQGGSASSLGDWPERFSTRPSRCNNHYIKISALYNVELLL